MASSRLTKRASAGTTALRRVASQSDDQDGCQSSQISEDLDVTGVFEAVIQNVRPSCNTVLIHVLLFRHLYVRRTVELQKPSSPIYN